MSDERFARQYRFELPSGFPLTSPCTSIVHHLSGPNIYALARLSAAAQARPGVPKRSSTNRLPYAFGFVTHILAHMLDSLVRVSRRVGLRRFTVGTQATVSRGGALRSTFLQLEANVHRERHVHKRRPDIP